MFRGFVLAEQESTGSNIKRAPSRMSSFFCMKGFRVADIFLKK
jgi:hypothetical protein